MKNKLSFAALLIIPSFGIGYLMAQPSSIVDESLAQIKKDIKEYPPEQRRVYVRGLREGIDTCTFLLPPKQADELAKNPKLRAFLDFLDKN